MIDSSQREAGRRPRGNRTAAGLSLALAIQFAPVVAQSAPQSGARGSRAVTVQLKWWHQFQFAGLYAAIEKGYYSRAHLDVHLVEGTPGMDFAEEVVSGRADYGLAEPSLLLDRARGRPVVVLAAIFQHSAEVLVARDDSGVQGPRDLIGRPVSISQPGMATILAMLMREGVEARQLFLSQPDPAFQDLLSGKVVARAAYLTDAPYILRQKGLAFRQLSPRSYGIDFYGDCLFTSEAELRRHPADVRAFREATLHGWQYAMDHPAEIVDWIARHYPGRLNREQLTYEAEAMRPLLLPDVVEVGQMKAGRWRHIGDTFVELGMLRADYTLDGFLYDPTPPPSAWPARAALGAGLLLLVSATGAAGLWLFNRRLRRTVQARTAELHAVAQQLRTVFDHTIDFLGLLEPDGRLIEVNPSALAFAGTTLPQVAGRPFWETPWWAHSPKARERCRQGIEAGRNGERGRLQTTNVDWRGETHVLEYSFTPIRDADGRVLLLVAEGHDLTEHKRAEQALRRASREWERTFDTVPDLICLLDRERRVLRANRALYEKLGRGPGELEGEVCTFLPHDPAAPADANEDGTAQAGGQQTSELEIPELGGWFMVSASPLHDEHGRAIGTVYVARDIESLREAAATRARLESQLHQAQKMEAIGRLAGGVAHDFNNMLAVILGNAQLLKRRLAAEMPIAPLVDIERAAERSRDITRQLLAFSRRQVVEPRSLDLNAAIASMRGVLVRLIGEDVELRFEPEDGLGPVRCDPSQLDQIILNLAANARDAMPTGGTLTIRTGSARLEASPPGAQMPLAPGEYGVLAISDDGVGIEPELMPRIFEPFLTTKREGYGTGLGLATVYGIVEQSGGSIAVESAPGSGATFRIFLPRALETEPDGAAEQAGGRSAPAASVLLVEDDEPVRSVTAGMLEALGCTVLEAGSPEQALELAGRGDARIDLLLTDIVMPRLGGRELGERIAALRPGIPVLYMSGYAEDASRPLGVLEAGAHFLQKPFGIDALAAKLTQVLDLPAAPPAATA